VVQPSLFSEPGSGPEPKQSHDRPQRLTVLVTVKAAPNPSEAYGETVCVAGLRIDPMHEGWVRLYPINFRYLDDDRKFAKYDVITVDAVPSRGDPRSESWRPNMETLRRLDHLPPWVKRDKQLLPYLDESMCGLYQAVLSDPPAQSLGLIRPRSVDGLDIQPHGGWSVDEQRKIDHYVNQLDIFGSDRTPLKAPRFRAWYRYRCLMDGCGGHRQGLLDWELVAFQRYLPQRDDEAIQAIRQKFLTQLCAPERDVLFYVGNQAKRQQTFSVLGVYWPPRH
jgi:hypothetical protein